MPISTQDLANFVVALKGIVPEPSRTLICRRLLAIITKALGEEPALADGIKAFAKAFRAKCQLSDVDRWVPDDLHVEATKLSLFCDKWMSVEAFKPKDDPSAEWQPITPEQNALRVTMIKELKDLAKDNA